MNPLTINSGTHTSYVPHLLNPSSSDTGKQETESSYATQLLAIPNGEICRADISPRLLEAWSDDIQLGFKNQTFPWFIRDNWSMGLLYVNPNNPIGHVLEIITKCLKGQSGLDSPDQTRREFMVSKLLQLDKAIYIPEDHPAKLVLYKFMDAILERLALDKQIVKSRFLLPLEGVPLKSVLCFKTSKGWRCADFDNVAKQPFNIVWINTNKTQTILIDEKEDYIQHPAIIISASSELSDHGIRIVDFVFYRGSADILESKKNSFVVSLDIDIFNKKQTFSNMREYNNINYLESKNKHKIYTNITQLERKNIDKICTVNVIEKDALTEVQKKKCFEEIEEIFPIFKEHIVKQLKESASKSVLIPLFRPQSQSDKLLIIYKLLTELSKKHVAEISSNAEKLESTFSEEEIAQISYIAEKLEPSFSKEELDALILTKDAKQVDPETVEVKPKAILSKLYSDIKEKRAQCVRAELAKVEKKEEVTSVKGKEKEFPSIAEATEKSQQLEEAAKKELRRQLYLEEQLRMEKKTTSSKSAIEEPQSKLELSSGQQAAIDSIYQGNPLKAKDFAVLATALLQKVAAEDIHATSTAKRKGSHVKFHLKRNETSSGVTFVIQHKKKDHRGSLKTQRATLDQIFSLK